MALKIYRYFLILTLTFFAAEAVVAKEESKKFTVVIDAGHGGKDIGATDNGVMEKNINLKVAKHLESLLNKKLKDTKVVMTRTGDNYLTLQERADKANKAHGDLFISIHTNSVDKKNKNRKNLAGSSVYTLGLHKDENNLEVARRENSVIELEKDYEQKYSGFDPQRDESYIIFEMAQKKNLSQSIKFAESVEKELENSGRQNRGVHQAGFWVLWATSMPSVLIELDFICNPQSAAYISSDKGAKELAEAIFKAIKRYQETWNKSLKGSSAEELSNTYLEGSEGNLEETYTLISDTPIATARVRQRNASGVQTSSTIKTANEKKQTGKQDERRRRSNHSKAISMGQSYEKDDIKLPTHSGYAVATSEVDDAPLIAQASSKEQKEKGKSKKSEKKKKLKEEKKKEEKAPKKRKEDAHNAKLNKLVTVYKIQILASEDLLNQNNVRFCGLKPITTYKENNLYKYYYGESTDKSEVEMLLADVKKKIPDAFIVSSKKSIATNK